MKREFKGIQRKGLPGGPHEQFTYVTGVFMQDMYHVSEAQKGLEKYQGDEKSETKGFITYKSNPEYFDNRARFDDNLDYSDLVKKKVYAGTHAFNPSTGELMMLPKANKPVDELTTAYSKRTEDRSAEEQAMVQRQGRRNKAFQDLQALYRNPVFYAPAAVAGVGTLGPAAMTAMSNPLVSGPLSAYGVYDATTNSIPSAIKATKEGRYLDATGNAAMASLDLLPIPFFGTNLIGEVNQIKKGLTPSSNYISDFSLETLKETKPFANRFEHVIDANDPKYLTKSQAENLTEQGKADQVASAFEEGANTIDNFKESYLKDLTSEEGIKRLIQQEYEYQISLGIPQTIAKRDAEMAAFARINEIKDIQNTNRKIALGESEIRNYDIADNSKHFSNAYYRKPGYEKTLDDVRFGLDDKPWLARRIGLKSYPGSTLLGTQFSKSMPVASHEIAGHGLQAGRRLPVDDRLTKLEVDVTSLNKAEQDAYSYFMEGKKGDGGLEPSAFLHEFRESMLQVGLIKNRYQRITPELIEKAKLYFTRRPSGVILPDEGFLSSTRIVDFIKPTEYNFSLLARELNKLPVLTGVAGTAALSNSERQKGGEGYRLGAEGYNDLYKIIPSGNITMTEKDGSPLEKGGMLGIDNLGNQQMMYPGYDYKFPGDAVMEIPMMQDGNGEYNFQIPGLRNRMQYDDQGNKLYGYKSFMPRNAFGFVTPTEIDPLSKTPRGLFGAASYRFPKTNISAEGRVFQSLSQLPNKGQYDPSITDVELLAKYSPKPGLSVQAGPKLTTVGLPQGQTIFDPGYVLETTQSFPKLNLEGTLGLRQSFNRGTGIKGGIKYMPPSGNTFLTGEIEFDPSVFQGKQTPRVQLSATQKLGIRNEERPRSFEEMKEGGAIAKKQLNSDLLKTYKNYINGIDESAEAVRAYDKLNRIFYKESKLNNMSAPNYIMTHIIPNA